MAIINKGILGAISGKVGNVVGATWNGIGTLRSLPAPSTAEPTTAQLTQRAKFAAVLNFLQPLVTFVRVGFNNVAVHMTAFNAAFSNVFANAVTGTYPNFTIDYPNVLLSKGNLENAPDASAASATAGTVTLTWDPALNGYLAQTTDKVLAVVYNPVKDMCAFSMNLAARSAGTLDITVPSTFSGDTVHVYLSFAAAAAQYSMPSRNEISNSIYAGSVLVS